MTIVWILVSLGVILIGAELFTNGIEWLGLRLNLRQGAVGSILAALGTALPETSIPVIAILSGKGAEAEDIGVGAILGAPFLLSTLGFLVLGIATIVVRKGQSNNSVAVQPDVFKRDITFFLGAYTVAITASLFTSSLVKVIVAFLLVGTYLFFVYRAISDQDTQDEEEELSPLYMARKSLRPHLLFILVQVAIALSFIILGANTLVGAIESLAGQLAVPAFILSVIIIPIATELPETFNSVIWIRQKRDTLAVGNITGAMVFQSTLVPALGIALTPWKFDSLALLTGILSIVSAAFVLGTFLKRGTLNPNILILSAIFYLGVPLTVGMQLTGNSWFYLWGLPFIFVLLFISYFNRRKSKLY